MSNCSSQEFLAAFQATLTYLPKGGIGESSLNIVPVAPQEVAAASSESKLQFCVEINQHDGGAWNKCFITIIIEHTCGKQPTILKQAIKVVSRGSQKNVRNASQEAPMVLHPGITLSDAVKALVTVGTKMVAEKPVIYSQVFGAPFKHTVCIEATCPDCTPTIELVVPSNILALEVIGDQPTKEQKKQMEEFKNSSTPASRKKRHLEEEKEEKETKRLKEEPSGDKEIKLADATKSDDDATEPDDDATESDDNATESDDATEIDTD
jgi:hypothetical protein